MSESEKEVDISVFTALLDSKNTFKETVEGEQSRMLADELKAGLENTKRKYGRLTMAQRDKLRPKGFSV